MNVTEGIVTDYSGIEFVSSGSGPIGSKVLPYEKYEDSGMGAVVKFYMDEEQVHGIKTEFQGFTNEMIISNARNSVPDGAFDLPSDYKKA